MKGLRVLLAEDDGGTAASIVTQLEALGHAVAGEARDGREAVRLAAELRPEAVVMDIEMPDMDGIEAAQEIARQTPVPVIFLSGFFDQHLLAGVVTSGGMAYLLKPATAEQLGAALALATQRFQEMADLREQAQRLNEALEARKQVSRAVGTLMVRHSWEEQEAQEWMQKEAFGRHITLAEVACTVLGEPRRGEASA